MSRSVVGAVVGSAAVAGALATAGLVVLVSHSPGAVPLAAKSRSLSAAASIATAASDPVHGQTDADTPWARASDRARTRAEYFAALNDPANSDLEPGLARRLAALGTQFLRADISGDGRGAFGDYWGRGTDDVCCREVVIHAAAAERHLGRDDIADVAVIWSATRVGGGSVAETTTVVHFVRRASDWQPLHPWELP